MKKPVIILIIFFICHGSLSLSLFLVAPDEVHGGGHDAAHYCEISKGPCKHKEACPLKDRHKKNFNDHDRADHHKKSDADTPYLIASTCHTQSDSHHINFYTIERLFITTLLLPPLRWGREVGSFFYDEIEHIDNFPDPFFRPPQRNS